MASNEIEHRDWATGSSGSQGQSEILPEIYARAYHDIYTTIIGADARVRIANGRFTVTGPVDG